MSGPHLLTAKLIQTNTAITKAGADQLCNVPPSNRHAATNVAKGDTIDR